MYTYSRLRSIPTSRLQQVTASQECYERVSCDMDCGSLLQTAASYITFSWYAQTTHHSSWQQLRSSTI